MKVPPFAAPLRRLLVLALVVLALSGLAGCSLPGTAAPTATPLPTVTSVPVTATAQQVAVVTPTTPSVAPAPPTATATIAPTATATMPPVTPITSATLASPTMRPATPGTPGTPVQGAATPVPLPIGDTQLIQDEQQACEMRIPVSFAPTSTPGAYAGLDGKALIALQSLNVGPDETLDDLALPFVGEFIPTVEGYEQTAVIRLADNLRIDFTGNLLGRGNGTLYFHQFGTTICAVTLFVGEGTSITYEAFFEALIASLRPKGVG